MSSSSHNSENGGNDNVVTKMDKIIEFVCSNHNDLSSSDTFASSDNCGFCDCRAVVFSPSGSHVAFGYSRWRLMVLAWNNKTNRPKMEEQSLTFQCNEKVCSLAFGEISQNWECNEPKIKCCGISFKDPGNRLVLAAGLTGGRVKVYSVYKNCLLLNLLDHKGTVNGLSFKPNGSLILCSASSDSTLKLWDLKNDGNLFKTLKAPSSILSCCWSPCGELLASTGRNHLVLIWRSSDWSILRLLDSHKNKVLWSQFSADGFLLATASADSTVIVWDPWSGEALKTLNHLLPPPSLVFAGGENGHAVRDLAFAAGGQELFTVCDDGFLRLWDLEVVKDKGKECVKKCAVPNAISCALSPDNSVIAIGMQRGRTGFFAAPMECPSLSRLCRSAIRKQVTHKHHVQALPLPSNILNYLS